MRWLVVFVLVGCGRVGFDGVGVDAEGGIDAPPAVGTARVIAGQPTLAFVPAPGLIVWSNHVDGTIDEITMTGEDGTVDVRVDAGGWVSAYFSEVDTVASRLGVLPGDTLRFGEDTRPPCGDAGRYLVTYPTYPGASRYDIGNGCETFGQIIGLVTQQVTSDIPVPLEPVGSYDLTVHAYDSSPTLLGSLVLDGVMIVDGGSTDFGGSTWRAPVTATVGLDGLPTYATSGSIAASFSTGDIAWRNAGEAEVAGPISNQVLEGSVAIADVGATRMSLYAQLDLSGTLNDSTCLVAIADAPIGRKAIPELPAIPANVVVDDADRTVGWQFPQDGETEHIQLLLFSGVADLGWTILVPPDTTKVTLPAQPPEVPMVFPLQGAQVMTANDTAIDGWDDARQRFDREHPFIRLFGEDPRGVAGDLAAGLAVTGGESVRLPRRGRAARGAR